MLATPCSPAELFLVLRSIGTLSQDMQASSARLRANKMQETMQKSDADLQVSYDGSCVFNTEKQEYATQQVLDKF